MLRHSSADTFERRVLRIARTLYIARKKMNFSTRQTRYGVLKNEKCDERFRIFALRDGRIVGSYDLDTSVDPMLSQSVGMNQSRDGVLIEERRHVDDTNHAFAQILNCYAGNRVVEFGFPRTISLRQHDTVLDLKQGLGVSSCGENEIVVMCDEVEGSKSRSVKDKIVLKDDDILCDIVPGVKNKEQEEEVSIIPSIYIQHVSRKQESTKYNTPILSEGIKINST